MSENTLTVLVVGSGGREHTLYQAADQSPLVGKVLCAPGNGGIPNKCRRAVDADNIEGLVQLALDEGVKLVIVGPEAPLVNGIVDEMREYGITAFGPTKRMAQLEGSKGYTKQLCDQLGVPTAAGITTTVYDLARDFIVGRKIAPVIKDDGLCGGKGVTVPETETEALAAAQALIDNGRTVVVEERLFGKECSVMAFCDGENVVLLPPSRDYKRAHDGDKGPNTGGMGAYSPLPDVDSMMLARIERAIVRPIVEHTGFRGLLYAGLMLTASGPKLLEFNVRFGDPECQVVLPRLQSDPIPYMIASTVQGGLSQLGPLEVSNQAAVCTVLASHGYPGKYETGKVIVGINNAERTGAHVYHAGTDFAPGRGIVSTGGRVLSVVGLGDTIAAAREQLSWAVDRIRFGNKYFRKDIAAGL